MDLEACARAYFAQHFNCAQSTFAPFAMRFGLSQEEALKIATPFGGGIGHSGLMCGAVSGGLMAIGLFRGISIYDRAQKYACYDLAQKFMTQFTALHGEITCPGLLGLDIGDPDELEHVRALNLFNTLCPDLVGDAVRLVIQLLEIEP